MGLPGVSRKQGIFCNGNKAKKMIENKGTCKIGEQREHGEIFLGGKGTKEEFSREHRETDHLEELHPLWV
jgi:hypothetical protein